MTKMLSSFLSAVGSKSKQIYLKSIVRKKIDFGLFYAHGRDNVGDSMVPWLIEEVCGKRIPYSNPRETLGAHLFSIGSILQYADAESVVWGSGFISANSKLRETPRSVLAVRGPLTRDRLVQLGGQQIDCFGDPAILTPRFIRPNECSERFRIGLIPHYVDKPKIRLTKLSKSKSFLLCDIETNDLQKFIDQIAACDVVVSSSLHGVILSESFGIPAIWARFDSDVVGDGFKFSDYYASTGRRIEPSNFYSLDEAHLARSIAPTPKNIASMAERLLEVFPYELCK